MALEAVPCRHDSVWAQCWVIDRRQDSLLMILRSLKPSLIDQKVCSETAVVDIMLEPYGLCWKMMDPYNCLHACLVSIKVKMFIFYILFILSSGGAWGGGCLDESPPPELCAYISLS